MSSWVNRTLYTPGTSAASHTVTFTAASAGSLLVAVAAGGMTFSTPTGWTLPTDGSAVSYTGHYVWWKIAAAGESSFTTTHNGAGVPAVVVYEFPAGSTFLGVSSGTSLAESAASSTLPGLTGTSTVFGSVSDGNSQSAATTTWTPAGLVKDIDLLITDAANHNSSFSVAYQDGYTGTSFTPTGAVTSTGGDGNPGKQALTFALSIGTGGTAYTATPADALGFADAVTAVRAGSTVQTPNDALGIADAVVLARGTAVTAADQLAIADTPTQQTIGFAWTDDDDLAVQDAAARTAAAARPGSDMLGFADLVDVTLTGPGDGASNPADGLGFSDAVIVQLSRIVTIDDLLQLIDQTASDRTPPGEFVDIVADDIVIRDHVTAFLGGSNRERIPGQVSFVPYDQPSRPSAIS